MNSCSDWRKQMIEEARGASAPSPALRKHLQACPECESQWDLQRALTLQYRELARTAEGIRPRRAAREQLLREFEIRHPKPNLWPRFAWATAAVVLLAAVLYVALGRRPDAPAPIATSTPRTLSASSGFVPVPYVPPLAKGEVVTIVRAKLPPAALHRMGLAIDSPAQSEINTEIMMGEDGFPRAVRVY